jgi:hypothetical protein
MMLSPLFSTYAMPAVSYNCYGATAQVTNSRLAGCQPRNQVNEDETMGETDVQIRWWVML